MPSGSRSSLWQRALRVVGPGFITGASDDDPAGIATYAQTGAQFGYRHLWAPVFSLPFMVAVQEMCGRIGMVTGQGIAGVLRRHYPRPVLVATVFFLLLANTVNIGADLGAMAASAQMLFGAPFWLWIVGMTAITLLLEIFLPYQTYARTLKFLILSLLAYVIIVFVVEQDWTAMLWASLAPSAIEGREQIMNIVAVFGTTIAPYLFFWQADEEVEEEIAHRKIRGFGLGQPRITRREVRLMRIDTFVGMFISNLIAYFIIATAASTLFPAGITHIETAADAAEALRPLAGDFAYALFAMGILGTGFLAVPILAGSASYAVAEAFRWEEGLSKRFTQAEGFYLVMIASTLLGLLINLSGVPPFRMLYYTAVLNGIIAPLLIACILLIANNPRIMGAYRNGWLSNALGGAIMVFMGGAGALLISW